MVESFICRLKEPVNESSVARYWQTQVTYKTHHASPSPVHDAEEGNAVNARFYRNLHGTIYSDCYAELFRTGEAAQDAGN